MHRTSKRLCVFLSLALLLSILPGKRLLAYNTSPVVAIDPPELVVDPGTTFTVKVSIEGASDLGGYEFEIDFDPSVVQVVNVEETSFLESTGRTIVPVGPRIDNTAGTVVFGAASGGSASGPDGAGELAVITWEAVGVGVTDLDLCEVIVLDTAIVEQTITVEDGRVQVGSALTPTREPTGVVTATPTRTPAVTATSVPPGAPTATATASPTSAPPGAPTVTASASPMPGQTGQVEETASPPEPSGPAETAAATASSGETAGFSTPTGIPLLTPTTTPSALALENEVTPARNEEQATSGISMGWLIGGGVVLIVGLALIGVGIYSLCIQQKKSGDQ